MEDKKKVNLGNKPVPKKAGKPAAKDARPAAKAGKPAVKDARPVAKTGKPAAKANKPAESKAVKDVDIRGNAVSKKPSGKGKYGKAKPEQKPWEKMTKGAVKNAAAKSASTKDVAPASKKETKQVKEMRDFLYLVPKRVTAKSLAGALSFLDRKSLEVWEEECVVEIAAQGIITFEDIRDSLEKEDKEVLNSLRMKQVISCDYESTDAELVQKIMATFLKEFGGKIASDTEDFTPFMEVSDL